MGGSKGDAPRHGSWGLGCRRARDEGEAGREGRLPSLLGHAVYVPADEEEEEEEEGDRTGD